MRILVTAGPTREHFDPVRFISNGSTGKMGYAVAAAACARGHHVVLVSGPVSIVAPDVEVVPVTSAEQMLRACCAAFGECDAAVMTAAVADWRPAVRLERKVPKQTSTHSVVLEPTPDICATLGARKGHRVLVGFAVQDFDRHERAEAKMARKRCDAMVLTGLETIGSDEARVEIKVADQPWSPAVAQSKERIGQSVVELVERLLVGRGGR